MYFLIVGFQTWIGHVDVKSSPVYFYVQKDNNFNMSNTNVPIPFEIERLNVGGAMNLTSGTFTAPRKGTYFFSFSGISGGADLNIFLNVNGSGLGMGHTSTPFDTLTQQSTLHLNAGDKVWVQSAKAGYLHDNGNHYTHFTGWLLQEDFAY